MNIYHKTNNIDDILEYGCIYGHTEGSVYGMRINNAPRWRTLMEFRGKNDELWTIIFINKSSRIFKLHPAEGVYSLYKRLLLQYKAPFGDIVYDKKTCSFHKDKKILIIRDAWIEKHSKNRKFEALFSLWSRRVMENLYLLIYLSLYFSSPPF